MKQDQVDGLNLLVAACKGARLNRQSAAYVLATAMHETGAKMQPVRENLNYSAEGLRATWPSRFSEAEAQSCARKPELIANKAYGDRMGNSEPGDGWRYRGRGYVQITGRDNYRRLGNVLGEDLEGNPELACDPNVAAKICVVGMQRGLFTGVSLDDVSEPMTSEPDFEGDRAIVNGRDRAKKIAGYADVYYEALKDVDLLAESRTVKAAKATQRDSSIGTAIATGTAITGAGAQVLTEETDSIISLAQKGMKIGEILNWGNAGWIVASILVVILVVQRTRARRIEAARREDNEVLGV